ncbi:TPA: ABC transporter permease [Clostridium perfringens]|nr:ABC transporter permease [Clostridium perfringens]
MKSNNLILDKYKSRGIRGLIVLGIAYFFLMGNYRMIRYFFQAGQGNLDISIINKCFSMGSVDKFLLFLFLVWSVGFLFEDKEKELKENLAVREENTKKYFFSKVILIYGVSLIPMVINIFIKLIFYIPYRNSFSLDKLIISFLYFIALGLLFTSIIFIMNLIVKDRMFAGIFPIFFMEGLILIFSVSELLISDKLIWVRNFLNFIGEKVLLIFNLLNLDLDQNFFSLWRQFIFIIILVLISVLLIYISSLILKIMNLKYLDRPYFFEIPRYFIYIFMSVLIGFVFVHAIGYLIIMFIPSVSYVKGTFMVNIASLISMVLLFVFLEILYRRKILNKDLIEDNIEVCNEIQPCIDFVILDKTTGFLDNNNTIDKEENFNNSL